MFPRVFGTGVQAHGIDSMLDAFRISRHRPHLDTPSRCRQQRCPVHPQAHLPVDSASNRSLQLVNLSSFIGGVTGEQ